MKDSLRKKFLREIPMHIVQDRYLTYAAWLEEQIDSVLQDMHRYAFDEFHKHRKKNTQDFKISLDGKEFNEILRLGKLKVKEELKV